MIVFTNQMGLLVSNSCVQQDHFCPTMGWGLKILMLCPTMEWGLKILMLCIWLTTCGLCDSLTFKKDVL